ncbi:sulfate transporter [Holotrichia oblita]|uniref:Sulfate transporter n=1 Tax=Holotrichia oblita TaxID=644536 RepID=A0ACB9SNB6_HOLOL|nr:sulfate transporter [Holotrichia oblita]
MPMKLRNLSIRKSLIGLVPIFEWAPKYNTHKLVCDLIAGVTVGLTVMPQSLAYATLAGLEPQGMPTIQLPPFETVVGNRTVTFGEMVCDLGTSIFLVPVIAVLGNVAIAKAFASGQVIDATQELLTLSLCSILGSFFSSMPITGSFSRSAVNHASGVQTPLGGVFTGKYV